MAEVSTLLTVASISSGFGVTVFVFRLQRELVMQEKNLLSWIPWADRLVIASVLISLLFVIIPLVSISSPIALIKRVGAGGCSASSILLAGYIPAILAHYRFIFGDHTKGRWNPEPAEKWIVITTVSVAMAAMIIVSLGVL